MDASAKHTVGSPAGFIPMMKAGPLRNGAERGHGSIFHAVPERENEPGVPIYDNATALCGQFPSIMWSSWRPEGQQVTCPHCLKKLAKHSAPAQQEDAR